MLQESARSVGTFVYVSFHRQGQISIRQYGLKYEEADVNANTEFIQRLTGIDNSSKLSDKS